MIMKKDIELAYLKNFGIYLRNNPNMIEIFQKKSEFIRHIRNYLYEIGAIELEMPCLHVYREGAPVHQFVTTHPLTGERFYLRHCMEDHLKRVCNLFEQAFELGKAFRVENEDKYKANEFTVMEYVGKDISYEKGVELIKNLITESVSRTFGTLKLQGIDFEKVNILPFDDLMNRTLGYGIYDEMFREKSFSALSEIGIQIQEGVADWEIYEELLKHILEPSIFEPTIIINYPIALQHVAEVDLGKQIAKRFSIIVKGIEVCDGGVKFSTSDRYKVVYDENAEYRERVLNIKDNEVPKEYYEDIDCYTSNVFTSGFGVDRLFAICSGKTVHEIILFPHH